MKVLLLVRRAEGGIATHVAALLEGLGDRFDFTLAGEGGEELVRVAETAGVPWAPVPLGDGLEAPRREALERLVRLAEGAAVVHAHGLRALAHALPLGCPVVYTAHSAPPAGPVGMAFRLLERRLARRAAVVFAVSPAVAQGLPMRAETLPPLIGRRSLAAVGPPSPEPVIGTLARLERRKGLTLLLAALAELRRRQPGVRLVIGGDGPERASLEAAAAGLPVTFLGPVPWSERPAFFAGIRLYAQPSLSEGLGLAVLEAAAAGRAAVVTDRGGLPGTVVSGETGFVVPAEPGALAQALAEGLARADELGAAARARALKDGDGAALVAVAEAYRRVACPCQ